MCRATEENQKNLSCHVAWLYAVPVWIVVTEVPVVPFRQSTQMMGNWDIAVSFLTLLCTQVTLEFLIWQKYFVLMQHSEMKN
jgi:hypothetical protein